MSKKNTGKIGLAAVVAASALVTANPAQAATSAQTEALVKQAEATVAQLKPYYSATKADQLVVSADFAKKYNAATAAVKKAIAANPAGAQLARLQAAQENHLKAARFIDAVKNGGMLMEAEAKLAALLGEEMDADTKAAYDALSAALRKFETVSGKVYGAPVRELFNKKFLVEAKTTREIIKYEVDRFLVSAQADELIAAGKVTEAKEKQALLERLEKRSLEIEAGLVKLYPNVDVKVDDVIEKQLDTRKDAIDAGIEKIDMVKVEAVSATSSKTLKVTFNKVVDTTKAEVTVSKDGIKVNTSKVTFADDKKSATIELSTKLTKGDYTVNVAGVAATTLTGTATVADEKVAKIEILSENAPLIDADNDSTKDDVTVGYRVLNQYGEDITKTTSLTSNLGTAVDLTNGKATITGNYKIGDKIPLTLINVDSAVSATAILTASAESRVADVAVSSLYNKDGKTLNEDTDLSADAFYLIVDAKDQYGNAVSSLSQLNNDLIISETNNTVVDAASTFTTVEVNGVTKTALKLNGPVKAGSSTVTLISNTTGKNATFNATVAESVRADAISISQPSLVVAGEDAYVPVTVTGKTGTAITDVKVLNNATKGVKVTTGSTTLTNPFVLKDGVVTIKVPSAQLSEGYVSLVALSSTNKVATATLNVKKAATPTVIRGLDTDFGTTLKGNSLTTLDATSFVVEDQYGRVMTTDKVKAWITAGGSIEVTEDTNSSTVTISGDNKIATSADSIRVNAGAANGTEKLTAVLYQGDKKLTNSTKEFSLRVTNGSEYKSFTVDTIGTVYGEVATSKDDAAAYDKVVKVYGVLSDGSKVRLTNGTDYNVTSSNSTVNSDVLDGVINANTALTYDTNATTKVVPVKVTINANGQELVQDVTFAKEAPKATTVTLVEEADVDADQVSSVTVASGDTFNIVDLTTGDYNLLVKDQYGVKTLATAGTGTVTFADTTALFAPTLTIVPVTGNVTISGNGTAGATVTGINDGEAFDVKVTYAGGATATYRVNAE